MKNTKFNISVSQKSIINSWVNGAFGVKAGRGLIDLFLKQCLLILDLSSARVRSITVFTAFVYRLYRKQGRYGLILSLKTLSVCLMQSVANTPLEDMGRLGPRLGRTKGGLPRIIPKVDRERIRRGDHLVIKLWLSLFSFYRLIDFKGKLKFDTIIDPPKNFSCKSFGPTALAFFRAFTLGHNGYLFVDTPRLFPIASAGSTQLFERSKPSTSFRALVLGAIGLRTDPILWAAIQILDSQSKVTRPIIELFRAFRYDERFFGYKIYLGALAFLEEAAGKVRVIAMVDCWTQFLLKPLHDSIFEVLKNLETDGTMDQVKPIHRLLKKGHKRFWCYDLSAATDRLPISIQVDILSALWGRDKALAWKDLLVSRAYHYALDNNNSPGRYYGGSVKYACGQPMGALSSWAMLALTHHLIVARAAEMAGFPIGTFTSYAVLGDDIVIANGSVARQYLSLMQTLGVKIGLAKSLVSRNGTLEFAKRFFHEGKDCSPVSLKEILSSILSMRGAIELAKKHSLSLPRLLSVMGKGFRTKASLSKLIFYQSRRIRNLGIIFYSPWGAVTLPELNWFSLGRLIFQMETLTYQLDTPIRVKEIMDEWRVKIKVKIQSNMAIWAVFTFGDYRLPLESAIYHYTGSFCFFEQCSEMPKNYPVYPYLESLLNNLHFKIFEDKWKTVFKDLKTLWGTFSRGPTPSFTDFIKCERVVAANSLDLSKMLWLSKPSLDKRESMKVIRLWEKIFESCTSDENGFYDSRVPLRWKWKPVNLERDEHEHLKDSH